jgi:hypothetical protein
MVSAVAPQMAGARAVIDLTPEEVDFACSPGTERPTATDVEGRSRFTLRWIGRTAASATTATPATRAG